MTQIPFQKSRKAPFGVVLFALFLSSCMSNDGIEYDIPAGEQIQSLQLRIDGDGTPVFLAEMGMYYTTNAPLGPWDGRTILRNYQTVAFTGTANGWKRQAFRNILRNWNIPSMLLPDARQRIQVLINDRDRLSLFTRAGVDWNTRAGARIPDGNDARTLNLANDGYAVMMDGEGAWQSLVLNYKSYRMEVRRNDGTAFPVDTMVEFTPMNLISREGFNMVVGVRNANVNPYSPTPQDTGGNGLYSYAWNLGATDPEPRKRKISGREFIQVFSAQVRGEDRMYALTRSDTLAEFSLKGEEATFLRDILLTGIADSLSNVDPRPGSGFPAPANLWVDSGGCIHSFKTGSGTAADFKGTGEMTQFVHVSDCRPDADTLTPPVPDTAFAYQYRLTPFRFSPDGGIQVGLLLTQESKNPYLSIEGAARSWIYLASLVGGTWRLEKVLELEGTGSPGVSRQGLSASTLP